MTKETDLKYIKQVTNISVFKICKELKVDYYNVLKGTASAEAINKVRLELERRIKEL